MTRDDIIRMALEADVLSKYESPTGFCAEAAVKFAILVASAEREACAKVCETFDQREMFNDEDIAVADACATAIRARGQE